MRKNVYNNNIIMVPYSELVVVRASCFIKGNDATILDLCMSKIYSKYDDVKDRNFGFMKDDEVVKIISSILNSYYYRHYTISRTNIRNAFLYSIMTEETSIKLKNALINYNSECIADFIRTYGEDTFDYIMQHKDYSYEDNIDKAAEADKCIYLYHDGNFFNVLCQLNEISSKKTFK